MTQPEPLRITLHTPLKLGDKNEVVPLVQGILQALSQHFVNLSAPVMSGVYDEATMQSVARVQRACGLPATGNTDQQTWNHMVRMFCCYRNRHVSRET